MQQQEMKDYVPARKTGRCFNGFELDGGAIIHLVKPIDNFGFWGGKALCGTEPGRRGNGWGDGNKEANCPKCLKKLEKLKLIQP